jgi:hypothetical protein
MALMQLSSSITFAKKLRMVAWWSTLKNRKAHQRRCFCRVIECGHSLLPRTSADGRKIVLKECTPSELTIGTHFRAPTTSMSITWRGQLIDARPAKSPL